MKKTILVLAVMTLACGTAFADDVNTGMHYFSLWGRPFVSKPDLYMGFTNGLAVGVGGSYGRGDTPARELVRCFVDGHAPGPEQGVAMIDKYYRDNPEKWHMPLGQAIIHALTVKGGPCVPKSAIVR